MFFEIPARLFFWIGIISLLFFQQFVPEVKAQHSLGRVNGLKKKKKVESDWILNVDFFSLHIFFSSPAGRPQRSVGTQGSTAWVWGQQRPDPRRHEPHQGWPGHLHRQLAPLQPRAGQADRRVRTREPLSRRRDPDRPAVFRTNSPSASCGAKNSLSLIKANSFDQTLARNRKWRIFHRPFWVFFLLLLPYFSFLFLSFRARARRCCVVVVFFWSSHSCCFAVRKENFQRGPK